jgi:L-ascorbate 6-phosphate lactonase
MIPAVLRGQDLLADITITKPTPNEFCVWWLGQSGFAIKTRSTLVYIDLYLSDSLTRKYLTTDKPHTRLTEIPLLGGEIPNAKYVFASHTHTDHFDPDTLVPLFGASPSARLVLPKAIQHRALELGIGHSRLQAMSGGDSFTDDGLTVHAIPSAHPNFDHSEENGYPFLGFVIQADGLTFYHSGDTVLYDGLIERLKAISPHYDALFLPINGSSPRLAELGIAPNMSFRDAVSVADAIQPRLVIPHHYDMFSFNTADVQRFADLCREKRLRYAVLRAGERYSVFD